MSVKLHWYLNFRVCLEFHILKMIGEGLWLSQFTDHCYELLVTMHKLGNAMHNEIGSIYKTTAIFVIIIWTMQNAIIKGQVL